MSRSIIPPLFPRIPLKRGPLLSETFSLSRPREFPLGSLDAPPFPSIPPNQDFPPFRPTSRSRNPSQDEPFTAYLPMPKDIIKHVVGKKGNNIEKLQKKYNVEIVIHDDEAKITGLIHDVDDANAEIRSLVNYRLNQEENNDNPQPVVCWFFIEGNCKFGDNCVNVHPAGSTEPLMIERPLSSPNKRSLSPILGRFRPPVMERSRSPVGRRSRSPPRRDRPRLPRRGRSRSPHQHRNHHLSPRRDCFSLNAPPICQFFLNRNCAFGDLCHNLHPADASQSLSPRGHATRSLFRNSSDSRSSSPRI